MDQSATFARHFARLVWLLVHEPTSVDAQKASLRALVMAAQGTRVSLVAEDEQLSADGAGVSTAFTGVADVVGRMAAHGLRGIDTVAGAGAAELLGVARLLAGGNVANDGGAEAERLRSALGANGVRFIARSLPGALPELDLVDAADEPTAAPRRPRLAVADVAPRESAGGGGMFDQFAAPRTPSSSPAALLAELAQPPEADRLGDVLDELAVVAQQAVTEGKATLAAEILGAMVQRDAAAEGAQEKRVLAMALRRVATPAVLHAVAMQLPRTPERHDALVAVLARSGEDGADAVIELIASAAQQSDRRAYCDALLELKAGIPTLIHMLGDARWYVVRNAADLLGEMQAREAEAALTRLVQHDDDRVRRSTTAALMRLGTPRALQAIYDALRNPAPQVRMQAAAALATRGDVRTATALVRALDAERDEDVQGAFLLALGRLATPDAVARLLDAAAPDRGFFRRKGTAYRIAAVQGLAEARSAESLEALNALREDKDPSVRDAASFAFGRIARR